MSAFLHRIIAVIAQQAPPHGIRQDEFLFAGLRKLYGHNGSLTADDGSRAEGCVDHLPATYRTGHQRRRFLRRQAPVPLRNSLSGRGDGRLQLSLNGGAVGCGPQNPPPVIHLTNGQKLRFAAGIGDHAAPFAGGLDGAPAFLSVVIGFSAELLSQDVYKRQIPSYVSGFLYSALLDSFCSEQNARMTAMDAANQNAEELLSALRLQYNRVRQAAITQEITEISAGAAAQRGTFGSEG